MDWDTGANMHIYMTRVWDTGTNMHIYMPWGLGYGY